MLSNLLLGIEIGGTKLQLVAADASLQIVRRERFVVNQQEGALGIRAYIETTLKTTWNDLIFKSVGVGFGGPVDWQQGKIARSYQIEGWSDFQLAAWLNSLTNAPVFVENDANVAALGEAWLGAGKGYNPVFYCTLGSGVGGGLVVNQQCYHGIVPGEVEFGHLRMNPSGTTLQDLCAGWSVDAQVKQIVQANPHSILANLAQHSENKQAQWLAPAIEQGDVLAQQLLTKTCQNLAFALSHVVHLFHPEVVIIGGGLSLIGELLRAEVEKQLPVFVMDAFLPIPAIRLAQLGEDTVPMGALLLAKQKGKYFLNAFGLKRN